jgi:hypothetical protein
MTMATKLPIVGHTAPPQTFAITANRANVRTKATKQMPLFKTKWAAALTDANLVLEKGGALNYIIL